MITVAIIGVLAAIAIPQFVRYQAKTRRSEGYTHVAGIARAYKGYHAESGIFPDTEAVTGFASLPDSVPLGTVKMPWDVDTENFFKVVGWRPDGDIYYTYEIESDCGGCTETTCFTVVAHGDVDANGLYAQVILVHPMRNSGGAPVAQCAGSGMPLPATGIPTDPVTGIPLYDEPAPYLLVDAY
jgi:type IV pilus assembly protein PilA